MNSATLSPKAGGRGKGVTTKPSKNDELIKMDSYYKKLIENERKQVIKDLEAKMAFQRMDLERKWSKYFQEAERKLAAAEAIQNDLKASRENFIRLEKKCRELETRLKQKTNDKEKLTEVIENL